MVTSEIINARGYFWWSTEVTPEGHFAPNECVSGALTIDEAGWTRLRLDAILPRPEGGHLAALFDSELHQRSISGILAGDSKSVRLEGLRRDGAKANSRGPSSEGMLAEQCIISDNPFDAASEPLFDTIELDLSGYEEWLGLRSINCQAEDSKFSLSYEKPSDVSWSTDVGVIELKYGLSRPFSRRENAVNLREHARLRIKRTFRFSRHKGRELTSRLEDLIILLTDSERGFSFPNLYLEGEDRRSQLFYARSPRLGEDPIPFMDCWVTFKKIEVSFGDLVANWLTKHESYGPGFHLYMGNRRQVQMYPEHRFASLAWGIESLHRKIEPVPKENEKLSVKILRILYQISRKKDMEWTGSQLKGFAEPNLAKRIYDVLTELPIGLNERQLLEFSEVCARRRNDVSHFGGMREAGTYDVFLEEIQNIAVALDLLYHARILKEIGVADEHIRWWFIEGFHEYRIRVCLRRVNLDLPERAKKKSEF